MGKDANIVNIRTLLPEEIEHIAAGEVVARPKDVVKELVENAIDAGAKNIDINIIKGGLESIEIIDDGHGFSEQDILICAERHTTSKFSGLNNISYFGFRGEALYTIRAVGQLVIRSNNLKWENGKVTNTPTNKKNSVEVKNLFDMIPARKAFVNNPQREFKAIMDIIFPYAIFYDSIKFTVRHNKKAKVINKFIKSKGTILNFSSNYIIPDNFNNKVSCKGKILSNDNHPTLIFVNGRPISNRVLLTMIKDTYQFLTGRSNASFILCISCPFAYVDVNIHPSKSRVRFRGFDIVSIVKSALLSGSNNITQQIGRPTNRLRDCNNAEQSSLLLSLGQGENNGNFSYENPRGTYQIKKRYLIMIFDDYFIVIDQHAAHERIIADEIINSNITLSALIKPFFIATLGRSLMHLNSIMNYRDVTGGILVEAIADFISIEDIEAMVKDPKCTSRQYILDYAHKYGCNKSIRTGDMVNGEEAVELFYQLRNRERGHECNHGRPTWMRFDMKYLDNIFWRGCDS